MNSVSCPYCNKFHSEDAQFCPETGQRLDHAGKHCLACGEGIPEEASFCPNCGQAWQVPVPAESVPQEPWHGSPQVAEVGTAVDEPVSGLAGLADDTMEADGEQPPAPERNQSMRRTVGISLALLAILSLSAGAGYLWTAQKGTKAMAEVVPTVTLFSLPSPIPPAATPMVTEITQNPSTLDFPSPTIQSPTLTPSPILPIVSLSRKIIFSYGTSESERSLNFLEVDGGKTWQVASFSGGMNFPAPAPGGEQVVFSSRTGTNYDDWNLYLYNLTSGDTQQLANRGVFPDWCREASKPWIVYEIRNGETSTIWFMNLDDRQPRQLTQDGKEYRPKWSPDCSQIVFSKNSETQYGDLYIYDLASEIYRPLVVSEYDESVPTWSPDGQWISFSRRDEDTNNDRVLNANDLGKLYIIHPDGSEEHQLNGIQVSAFSPSWSPDSRQIVFSAQSDLGGMQILRYSLEDDRVYPLTEPGAYYHPRWVP